jgi:amidase
MARSVSDLAMLLTAVAGVDPADPSGPAAENKIAADYSTFLKPDALKGKRFGLLRQAMGYHPDVDASALKAVEAIKAAGGEVVDVKIAGYNSWNDAEFQVMLYEFKDGLNQYLKKAGATQGTLEALIAWNTANAAKAMPIFGQELFEQAEEKGPLTDAAYVKARDAAFRLAGKDGLLATLEKEHLDAVIAPSMSPAWPTDPVLGDHFVGAGYGMAAVARTPSLTVPIGDTHGLPLGLTFMGRPYSEGELIGFGFALEQATRARKAPQFVATIAQ